MPAELTQAAIREGLRRLGLGPGDDLMLHCSLSSLGHVHGGTEALIDAVLGTVSPGGTVLMPTLPDIYQPFDVRTSPSTVGKVSEAFRLRPDALRSRHPSHSVAAIGPRAAEYVRGHEDVLPTGPGSPYDRLRRNHGWVLLLGVDHDRNTMLHLAETIAGSAYLRDATVQVVTEGGDIAPVTLHKMAYGHRQFISLDRGLSQAGIQRLGHVGTAVARLMRADELVAFALERLRQDPAALLCSKPRCIFCLWARARIRQAQTGQPDNTNWQELSRRWGCGDPHCEVCTV
jgi:aminoglycoside N3'-acetyltransferase